MRSTQLANEHILIKQIKSNKVKVVLDKDIRKKTTDEVQPIKINVEKNTGTKYALINRELSTFHLIDNDYLKNIYEIFDSKKGRKITFNNGESINITVKDINMIKTMIDDYLEYSKDKNIKNSQQLVYLMAEKETSFYNILDLLWEEQNGK